MDRMVERFLKYVSFDTASDANSPTSPSTAKQSEFAKVLAADLREIGMSDVSIDEYAYVYATLPSNIERSVPVIGFLAHMDVSADVPTANIKPQIVRNYDGQDILLNAAQGIVLSPRDFPDLKNYVGQDLITTDGTTLLGSDDKAGIATILAAMEYLISHPEIKHGEIGRAHV